MFSICGKTGAQNVHARTLHQWKVYEFCDELQEIVERRLVAGTIFVVVERGTRQTGRYVPFRA